ncbi:MAG: hypothetical protein M0P73_06760 [Syntrophobacterales bacterium]|jgi:hypothetical protein|nr:hypothetical protein [Syntrophobacterales bacterium]
MMMKQSVLWGLMLLVLGMGLTAQGLAAGKAPAVAKPFTYNYTFKPGTEPDGFRGLKWQTDIATLDPLHNMEVLEILGPFTYYKKNHEDLRLGMANLESIVYEFWNGKFSGVVIKVKGENEFQRLKEYCFARFGGGQRSEVYQRLNVQDFYYNGVKTRMYLRFSDIDRTGELSMYSIALLSKQEKTDAIYLRNRANEEIKQWEKGQKK